MKIEIAKIKSGKNFRRKFDIDALKASIDTIGQLEPIGVTPDYVLVYGECRLRAAEELGWTEIDAVWFEGDEREVIAAGIFENMNRNSLRLGEECTAMAWLRAEWYSRGEIDRGGPRRD